MAIAPEPVPTSTTRTLRRPDRPRRGGQSPGDLPLGLGHEQLGLRPRDQRPAVYAEGQAVELLDAADVGDGLAGLAPEQRRLVCGRRVRPDRQPRDGR